MMENKQYPNLPLSPEQDNPELLKWLSVSGDMDDFIYYGEPQKVQSER